MDYAMNYIISFVCTLAALAFIAMAFFACIAFVVFFSSKFGAIGALISAMVLISALFAAIVTPGSSKP